MATLRIVYWGFHLTGTDVKWRQGDWDTRALVRGLKREPFKGELRLTIQKKHHAFTSATIEDFVTIIMPMFGQRLREIVAGPLSLIPIPNSNMAVGKQGPFRIMELAEMLAAGHGQATAIPSILWNKVRDQAHKKKEFRHPDIYEPLMRHGVKPPDGIPVVIFDDVITSGSQMIAGARFLAKNGFQPTLGFAIARAVPDQREGPFLTRHNEELDLNPPIFNLDAF